jgi:type II secretory pathway component GspD/PulD (secretin)
MMRQKSSRLVPTAIIAAILLCWSAGAHAQSRRHIKVVLETKQTGTSNQETVQGSGSVIIRRGGAQPSGRLTAGEKQTTVQRSSGIFTLVQDGGESILSVATRVPQHQVGYYRDYASGIGDIDRQIIFTEVGTSMRVSASALAEGQIRVRLTPRISYFSAERSGAIDLTEATTELVVPNGQPVSLGGSTTRTHEVTRRILGYTGRTSNSETDLVITATLQ